jgi:hypothetical protein
MQDVVLDDDSIIAAIRSAVGNPKKMMHLESTCDLMLRVRLGPRDTEHWIRARDEIPLFRENVDDGRYSTALVLAALHSSVKRLEHHH